MLNYYLFYHDIYEGVTYENDKHSNNGDEQNNEIDYDLKTMPIFNWCM